MAVMVVAAISITQSATRCTTHARTDQPTISAADLLAQHLTAGGTQATTNGCFSTVVFIRAHRTTGGTT